MTTDEQYKAIHQTEFYANLQAKLQDVNNRLSAGNITLAGDDPWLKVKVNGVPVSYRLENDNSHLRIGKDNEGKTLYEMTTPVEWIG